MSEHPGDQRTWLSDGVGCWASCWVAPGREGLRVLRGFLDEADLMASATAPKLCHHSVHDIFCGFHSPEGLDGAARWVSTNSFWPSGRIFVLLLSPPSGDPGHDLQVLDLSVISTGVALFGATLRT